MPMPAPESQRVGCAFFFGGILLGITGVAVLVFDLLAHSVIRASHTPCPAPGWGVHVFWCGGNWTVGEVAFLAGVAAIGIGLLVSAVMLVRAGLRRSAACQG